MNFRYSWLTQKLANYFPPGFLLRQDRLSVGQQLLNPLAFDIEWINKEVQRSVHNYLPHSVDPLEIDRVFTIQRPASATSFVGYDGTDLIEIRDGGTSISSFWYEQNPTRLKLSGTSRVPQKVLHEDLSALRARDKDEYFISIPEDFTHDSPFQTSLLTYSSGVINFGTATNSWLSQTSTSTMNGLPLSWSGGLLLDDPEHVSVDLTIGMTSTAGSTSTTANFVLGDGGRLPLYLEFSPSTSFEGSPYWRMDFERAPSTATDHSAELSMKSLWSGTSFWFEDRPPSWAWITYAGENVFSPSPLSPEPTTLKLQGIGEHGEYQEEKISVFYEGRHKSFLRWRKLEAVSPLLYRGETASIEVSLHDYRSTEIFDPLTNYHSHQVESPLHYFLDSSSGTSRLGWLSFENPDVSLGFSARVLEGEVELVDSTSSPREFSDFALDTLRREIWCLDSDAMEVLVYDVFEHWPQTAVMKEMRRRSESPPMILTLRRPSWNEVIISPDWRRRDMILMRHRIWVRKPDGTFAGLEVDGTEVPITSNFWVSPILDFAEMANRDQAMVFTPISHEMDQAGSYVFYLESEYVENDTQQKITYLDVKVAQRQQKTPKFSFALPTDRTGAVGIDFSPSGELLIAYESENSAMLEEERYSVHYDYYLADPEDNLIYFREFYSKIRIGLEAEGEEEVACQKTVLIVSSDDVLTLGELECLYLVVQSNDGAKNVTLPTASASQDGFEVVIKRWGANTVTILPSGGQTIDGSASLSLLNNKDAVSLIWVNGLTDWNVF